MGDNVAPEGANPSSKPRKLSDGLVAVAVRLIWADVLIDCEVGAAGKHQAQRDGGLRLSPHGGPLFSLADMNWRCSEVIVQGKGAREEPNEKLEFPCSAM